MNYVFTFYLGFDVGDKVYESEAKRERMMKRVKTLIGDHPVKVKMYRFPVSRSTTYVWNGLFQIAMNEGMEYFMVSQSISMSDRPSPVQD